MALSAMILSMLVFAHRGVQDRKIAENTLVAFRRAVLAGADGLEFDLRVSRDGIPVVAHDENLHRIAGDARRVRDLSAKELGKVVLRGQGGIPTLNDVTSGIPQPIMFDMEIKDRGTLDPLIKKLGTSASLRGRTLVSSFVSEDLKRLKKSLPDVRVMLLHRRWPIPFRGQRHWEHLFKLPLWGVGFRAQSLNPTRVRWLQRKGWKVAAWDEQPLKKEARHIRSLGVDIAIVYKVRGAA